MLLNMPEKRKIILTEQQYAELVKARDSHALALPPRHQKVTTGQIQSRPIRKIDQEPRPAKSHKPQKMHWLFFVGLGMMAVLILWVAGSAGVTWGRQLYNDIRYGTPRTYQVDQIVGQGGDSPAHPSHFIAINKNHQAIIIELKAGDPAQAITYTMPIHNDNGEAPVTLEFRDVIGDGKLDMIIHIHLLTREQIFVFINTGTQFRPAKGSDHIKL
jgi:hypothetical protein